MCVGVCKGESRTGVPFEEAGGIRMDPDRELRHGQEREDMKERG